MRPIPVRLIRPETVTISPISTGATVDAFEHVSMARNVRGTSIVIPAQINYSSEVIEQAPVGGMMARSVVMLLLVRDCEARSYTPHEGDLVTAEAFMAGLGTTDKLYITEARKHVEGQAYHCQLADKAPMRRS